MTQNEKMASVIKLAKVAMDNGELPIAAAVYLGDELVSSAYTTELTDGRFLVHAEQKALMEADMKKFPFPDRFALELFTNLEPCLMCIGMAVSCFVGKVFYAVEAPEDGAVDFVQAEFQKRPPGTWFFPEINAGILREQSIQLFREYTKNNKDKPELKGLVDFAQTVADL